jgi:multisubunit Na+/H+ antiporter MnhE subunit
MTGLSGVFFLIFAIVLVLMYLGIRRSWAAPGFIAGAGVLGSIISMMLFSFAQGNNLLHSVVVSLLVGGLFSGITLAAAWYFHVREAQAHHAQTEPPQEG